MSEGDDLDLDSMFPEERPPSPEPTIVVYRREKVVVEPDWHELQIQLVGSHPLWGHYLWNAARAFASYIDSDPKRYAGSYVLELGAGGGLPGLVTAQNGAKHVLLTDYPDPALLKNLEKNVEKAQLQARVSVKGHIWGHPVQQLLEVAPSGFDYLLLSDLIFNHSQHAALLETCQAALKKENGRVLVFYTHHRPHLAARDMDFFDNAREQGWICDKVVTRRYPPMFPEDPGDEEVRATVHGWEMYKL